MSEIKWIKITTDMFDDEKIDFISSLPEADAIIVTWIRLLTMAGKCNAGGYVFLTEKIPYTDEMLAHKFKKPLNIVRLALETFRKLDMIEMDENGIYFPKWQKYQNIDGMERIRQQTKARVQKHRQKPLGIQDQCNVTDNVTVTQSNETDIEEELDKEKEKEKNQYAANVFLTSAEYEKLGDVLGDADREYWILHLSEYKIKKKVEYRSDYLTILKWHRKDEKERPSYLQAVPDPKDKKRDPELIARDREIAFNQYVAKGGNPDEFRYDTATGA